MSNLKTELEIRQEIKNVENTISNYRSEYKNGNIPKDVFHNMLIDCRATIETLKWVLNENDRYD